jgi:DNA-binding transcriptional MocR family regulator
MDYHGYRDAIFASDLTAPQRLLALAISYHYNWKKQEPAFPSNATLSRETGLSTATIVRAKKVLIEKGYLLIQHRWDNSCEYTPCSQRATNNEYNNEVNNVKKKDSKESLNIITEVKAEEPSAINNDISFDEIFTMFERTSNEERNHRPAPAGRSNQERGSGSSPAGRYDIDHAELSTFNQELARAREESW